MIYNSTHDNDNDNKNNDNDNNNNLYSKSFPFINKSLLLTINISSV